MNTRKEIAIQETKQRANGGNRKVWLRRGVFVALTAAAVAITTTVVLAGGSEPANACFLGIPCW